MIAAALKFNNLLLPLALFSSCSPAASWFSTRLTCSQSSNDSRLRQLFTVDFQLTDDTVLREGC
ncbi:hypothetical protein FB446DRAFT_690684 [Lentinula raphanica]|nr:hypothetical protein FB446DRAFT_690684 [Lentinula raphanica]